MIRPKNDKALKIAQAILGVPANMQDKRTAKQKEIDRRLMYDRTSTVR